MANSFRRLIELESSSAAQDLSEAALVRFCSEIGPNIPTYPRFVNEARFGLSRLLPVLSAFPRTDLAVLEVGAGSCLLSAYLASKDLRVTALEPMGPEFDFFTDLQNCVLDFARRKGLPLELVRARGEQLALREQFDVAFTINALEHMRDPLLTIDNMYDSLKPGGVVLAHCPNYTIPFEVHFNILLVTRSKPVNERLYRSRIDRYPRVWNELNFIRYADVRRHLVGRGSRFAFNGSVLRDLVTRLVSDSMFAERMPAVVRAIGKFVQSAGLVNGLTLIPPRFQTPMEVLIQKS
jgi:SAM-dependent methyltransferase